MSLSDHDSNQYPKGVYVRELRLLLEEICCDLLRFEHVTREKLPYQAIWIDQEVYLEQPATFADIRVRVPGKPPYFVEVKYGYSVNQVVEHLARKYGRNCPVLQNGSKLVVVIDSELDKQWTSIESSLRSKLHPLLKLEVWNEAELLRKLRAQFNLNILAFTENIMPDLRLAIDRLKGRYAFGDSFANDPLEASLLYHFGFWKLHELRETHALKPRTILAPGLYPSVVVLFFDLVSFSSYMRDTRDHEVIRHILTSFYAKTRYQVLNAGGMVYQTLGDGMIALFGIPQHSEHYIEEAFECAKALVSIGNSITHEWQRHIDHVQPRGGCHIGIALGDLQFLSSRPFGRVHMAAVGDCINIAARLSASADEGEILISNALYQKLPEQSRREFKEQEPIEARNLGRISAWKTLIKN